MDTQRLTLGLLIASIVLCILAAATPYWGCGNLYADCSHMSRNDHSRNAAILSVLVLFTIGMVCIAIVLILDFIRCCMTTRDQLALSKARMVLLFLGVACIVVALLLYTAFFQALWSYLAAVVGGVFAIQVVIITLMTCSCVATTHHRVPA